MYIRVPTAFINFVIGKVGLFAFIVNISGKNYFGIKP